MASDLTSSTQRQIRRGNYQVFPDLRLLLRNGEKIDLSGKPFEIALMLIEANNSAVAKDDLLRSIWPNQIVEENNLQAHISTIRRALGPDRGLLKTEFGNGYRLELPGANAGDSPAPHLSSQFQVPLTATPLFGRLEELAVMDRLIAAGNLVTITGIGGIGKTLRAFRLGATSSTGAYYPPFQTRARGARGYGRQGPQTRHLAQAVETVHVVARLARHPHMVQPTDG